MVIDTRATRVRFKVIWGAEATALEERLNDWMDTNPNHHVYEIEFKIVPEDEKHVSRCTYAIIRYAPDFYT
jgi:hypothetical protein